MRPQRKFILEGIKRRASDIHVIPGDGRGRISIRTDGVVSHPQSPKIPAARMENLANAFSDMAGVNGYELMQRSKGAEINITLRTNAGTETTYDDCAFTEHPQLLRTRHHHSYQGFSFSQLRPNRH